MELHKYNYRMGMIMQELTLHLDTIEDMRNQIEYLNRCWINAYNGFKSKSIIKVSITASDGSDYSITYQFKNSYSAGIYSKFYNYLRKR